MKLSLTLCLFIFFASCNNELLYISDEKMVEILTDMVIADELLAKYGSNIPDIYRDSVKLVILNKHGFSESSFDSIFINVQKDLKRYHGLQSQIEIRLDSLEKSLEL